MYENSANIFSSINFQTPWILYTEDIKGFNDRHPEAVTKNNALLAKMIEEWDL